VTVFAGEMAGEAFEAFLGGLPNLDGPGPIEFRNVGAGDASESDVIFLDGEDQNRIYRKLRRDMIWSSSTLFYLVMPSFCRFRSTRLLPGQHDFNLVLLCGRGLTPAFLARHALIVGIPVLTPIGYWCRTRPVTWRHPRFSSSGSSCSSSGRTS